MKKIYILMIVVLIGGIAKGQWQQTTQFGHPVGCANFKATDSIIYGYNYYNLYKSTNNGLDWFKINRPFSNYSINKIAVIGNSICMLTNADNIPQSPELFLSQNKGDTWTYLNNSFPSYIYDYNDIIAYNNTYYLSTSKGLYTSNNNGLNWYKNLSLDSSFYSVSVNGNKIFAITKSYNMNVLKRTNDNGNSWVDLRNTLPNYNYISSVLSVANKVYLKLTSWDGNGNIIDSIYNSDNEGSTWKLMQNGLPSNISNYISFSTNNDTVFLHSSNLIFYSSIYDSIWKPLQLTTNKGFFAKDNLRIICVNKGHFLSQDYGNTWNHANSGLDITTNITSLASKGGDIYATTADDGIYKTLNNGQSWTPLQNVFLNNDYFGCLQFKDTVMYSVVNENSIRKSSDNGISWFTIYNTINNNYIYDLKINANKLIIATSEGLYISDDFGLNWNLIQNGLPDSAFYDIEVDGNKIYAITENCLYVSSNGGISWNILNSNCGGRNLSVEVNRILVGKNNNFDFNYSEDYGFSWSTTHQPFHVTEILLHSNLMFFAGQQMLPPYTSLFAYSNNKGQTLINENVSFICDPLIIINDTLYVGGTSVWKRPLSDFVGINETTPKQLNLYPNPATNTLTLNLSQLQQLQNATVSIYDIQGKQLLQQSITELQTQINISNFAKGIYIVKLQTDKETLQCKFIKQ